MTKILYMTRKYTDIFLELSTTRIKIQVVFWLISY